jgi:hypothetical protein
MHRLVNCPGSFALTKLYPERDDSPASMEGTAAHWVCVELLHGRRVDVGVLAPNGIAVTDEMIDGAEMYVATVPAELIEPTMYCHVEQPVKIPRVHAECWGTSDIWWLERSTIHVTDYKFGHGYVDEYMNDQLIAYVAGILDYLGMSDADTYVKFTIVQPRCFHRDGPVRTWACLASDLRERIGQMRDAAERALRGDGECVTGAWCNHCPAAHACEALQRSTQGVFDFTAAPVPSELPPYAKGLYLRRVQQAMVLLKSIEGGLEEEIEASIRSGVAIPGYELQSGQGRTGWSKPNAEVAALGDMLGANFRKEAFITPKQAQDMLKKMGIDGAVIGAYSEHKSGALKLVQSDMSKLKRVFQSQ